MREPVGRWFGAACLCCGLLGAGALRARGDEPRLADFFGFLPLEVYKLDARIGNLLTRDLDGDKTDDIVVGNNARSRIDLLLSRKKVAGEDNTPAFLKTEVNEISSILRLRF